MGTRGFYVYKWRGRYYIFYNSLDSYPSGLGQTLVKTIPSNPAQYQKWLEQKRAEYSAAELRLENSVFTVSPTRARDGKIIPVSASGLENLRDIPSYHNLPICDLWIEWIYLIDLDQEMFFASGDAYFCLSKVPGNWDKLFDNAERFHSSLYRRACLAWMENTPWHTISVEHAYTSPILPPLEIHEETSAAYFELEATFVIPTQSGVLAKRPIVTVGRKALSAICDDFGQLIWQVQYTTPVNDFIFREAAFLLLCICSCSPELLRMETRTRQTEETMKAPFAMLRPSNGIQHGPEFASAAFHGYHLWNTPPGSAPTTSSYWLLGVFVSLHRDLTSERGIQKAIIETVNDGRLKGGKRFNAVITSITHVILVRVTETAVQHTKRLRFVEGVHRQDLWAIKRWKQAKVSEEENDASDSDPKVEKVQESLHIEDDERSQNPVIHPSTAQWVDTDDIDAFHAIAELFEATAREALKPSGSASQGLFPNEIYAKIITRVDAATVHACLTVSRVFRDFSSEVFCMSEDLRMVSRPNVSHEPQCFHRTEGRLGAFQLSKSSADTDPLQWYPVIGHQDGTASFIPNQSLTFSSVRYDSSRVATEDVLDDVEAQSEPRYLDPGEVDSEYERVFLSWYHDPKFRNHLDGVDIEYHYSIFDKFLPSQEVIASSGDVMCLHSAAFFFPARIFGCKPGFRYYHWRSKIRDQIGIIPTSTCAYVGIRCLAGTIVNLAYGLAWAKPPLEDTPEGWSMAISEAMDCATKEFTQYQYLLWMEGQDVNDSDFAILVMIGRRLQFFHRRTLPEQDRIPLISDFPTVVAKVEDSYARYRYGEDGHIPWEEAGISVNHVRMRNRLSWEPIYEVHDSNDVVPLDALNPDHRPQIENAFDWVRRLAKTRGEDEETKF